MKAVMLKGAGQVAVVELAQPSIGPDEVLVRSHAVGICHSDFDLYRGQRSTGFYHYPIVPGHEWSGEVVAVGAQVHDIVPGNKVVCESFLACGICRNCRNGATNLCERGYDEFGFTRSGGLAEYVAVPACLVHLLPGTVSLEEAALLEPAAAVAHAFQRVQPRPGDVVAIAGDSPTSLLAVQFARLFSPAALVIIGLSNERLELARELGATHTVHVGRQDPRTVVQQLSNGRGADVVFEGAGDPEAVAEALLLARRGGSVILEGIAGGGSMLHLESDLFVLQQLTVYGIFGASAAAWTYALQLFNAGSLKLAPLISHRFPVEEYKTALDTLSYGKALKIVLVHT